MHLIKTAMQQAATDPKTGEIDMDLLNTGASSSSRARLSKLGDFIKSIHADFRDKVNEHGIKYINLYEFIQSKAKEGKLGEDFDQNVQEKEFLDTLMQLENVDRKSVV